MIDSRTWLFVEPFSLGAWKLLMPFFSDYWLELVAGILLHICHKTRPIPQEWVGSPFHPGWWLSWILVIPVMVTLPKRGLTYWGLAWALFTKRLYCGMHGCTAWPNNYKTINSVKVWYLELSVDATPNFCRALPQQLSHTPQQILSTGDTTPQASYIDLASTFL